MAARLSPDGRHRFRRVIRFTGGFVSKSYVDADRFFASIGEAARQGGRRSGHIRRSDGTELRLGIFTRFKGRELRDGARITLVADNDIRQKSYFSFQVRSLPGPAGQGRSRRSSLHLGIFLLRTGLIPEAGFRNIAVAFVLINAGKRRSGRRNPGRRRRFELRSSRLLALLQRGKNDPFAGVILSVDHQIGIELNKPFPGVSPRRRLNNEESSGVISTIVYPVWADAAGLYPKPASAISAASPVYR